MESEFAGLTINEEEEAILQVQIEPNPEKEVGAYRLVGCFLTASIIYFPAMNSTMANLWHPVRGVQVRDLREKGTYMEYDGSSLGKENRNFIRVRVQIDVRRPLKKKKQMMFYGSCSYVRFKYERLSLFCFYCGRLGHSDSFYEAKIALGVEVAEMGWDLSLRAQSRRALAMTSVWLREKGEGEWGDNREGRQILGHKGKLDPILGVNLEGRLSTVWKEGGNSSVGQFHTLMEHDLQDDVLIREEGKKRGRGRLKIYRLRKSLIPWRSRGGLGLAWRGDSNVRLQSFSKRHIDVIIEEEGERIKWRFTGFYRSLYSEGRDEAWNLLRQLGNDGGTHGWCVETLMK
ncbi:hypothetical protein CXB51_018736 [Gossypium anomalum]|uniref:Zinc knuckle CX2CX4HX4C domain-containing protein n=1 Tax=Gossypium anomalum TaxID=47600 RepID=A0A8J5YF15_9ROSI|nr:hypothetical protein CXB51_018736 [Gossypium anomalum]